MQIIKKIKVFTGKIISVRNIIIMYVPVIVDAMKGGRDSDKSVKVVTMSNSQLLSNSQSIYHYTFPSSYTLVIPI